MGFLKWTAGRVSDLKLLNTQNSHITWPVWFWVTYIYVKSNNLTESLLFKSLVCWHATVKSVAKLHVNIELGLKLLKFVMILNLKSNSNWNSYIPCLPFFFGIYCTNNPTQWFIRYNDCQLKMTDTKIYQFMLQSASPSSSSMSRIHTSSCVSWFCSFFTIAL